MMMRGSVPAILSVFFSAFFGTALISGGFQGWMFWRLNLLERLILIAAGLLMFIPGTVTDLAGIAIGAAILLLNLKKWEKGPGFLMKLKRS